MWTNRSRRPISKTVRSDWTLAACRSPGRARWNSPTNGAHYSRINPGPETLIQAEDVHVLLGGAEQIDRAIEEINGVREPVS